MTMPSRRIADQNAFAREVINFASGGVLRALGVQQTIHDETLSIVQRVAGVNSTGSTSSFALNQMRKARISAMRQSKGQVLSTGPKEG
jgi:hypothetical protein